MNTPKLSSSLIVLCACLALAGGCGSDPKAAHSADDAEGPTTNQPRSSGVTMSSEIGGLNQTAVDNTFAGCLSDLEKCLGNGSRRMEFLGGDVEFLVKIDKTGQLRVALLEESTLGDWDTERCMLDVLKGRTWPRPVGGETGVARKSFSFDMPNDVRPPTDWDSESIQPALSEISSDLKSCSAPGEYRVTMYVDTDGAPLAVGVAHSVDDGDEGAGCLVERLKAAKYPSPGSWPAKVSFRL
jgi:hypothetical protein